MATAKQKAAQERFKRASAQAKREGASGKNYAIRVGQILRGGKARSSAPSARRATARAAGRGARRAVASVHRAGKGFLGSLTPKKVGQSLIVLDAISEASWKAQHPTGDAWADGERVLAPLIDGGLAAKALGAAVEHGTSGLVKDLANWRFMGGKMPEVTLRRVANASPQLVTTPLAFRSYRELRQIGGAVSNENMFPRTAAITGIRVRNVRRLGQGDSRWLVGVRDASAPLLHAVLGSPLAPVAVGKIGSKIIEKAHVF